MGTKITFTNDTGRVSTAQNADGSIRWHCYERTIAGKTAVYVQRELGGVLQPEVKLIQEGDRPEVFFEPVLFQWIFLYRLNERIWMLRYLEAEVPVPQPSQSDTIVDQFQVGPTEDPETSSVAGRQVVMIDSVPSIDAYSGPPAPNAVGVGAASVPGMLSIRWRARPTSLADGNSTFDYDPTKTYIIGWNVYRRRADDGAVEKLNLSIVPFEGFDPKIYELIVPAVAGSYFVTQINYQGPYSSNLVEGRLKSPRDTIQTDGNSLPQIVRSFMDAKIGEGFPPDAIRFVVVSFAPVNIIVPQDSFPSHLGEGFNVPVLVTFQYTVLFVGDLLDTFPSHLGEGFVSRLTETGQGSVIIG